MSETYTCAACCAETENEPQAICDACDQADRDAADARLSNYRTALARLVAETDLSPAQTAIIREAGLH